MFPKQTLRDKVLAQKGRKKSRKLTVELNRIRDALITTGKGGQFTIACASSLLLMLIGCIVAIAIGNAFLIPVLAIAFALIPFAYAKRTISYYNNHIQQDLENALSLTTTAYLRTDDIITAVRETVPNLRPPIREIFADFVAESTMISSNTKQALRHLKERVKNSAFERWCDTLIMCQDDRTLKKSLMSTVEALSDVRQANAEVKVVLNAARTEYFMMAGLVLVNIPLLYALNQDWYNALMHTVAGKLVLAVCGFAIIITGLLMFRYTKPIEYRK